MAVKGPRYELIAIGAVFLLAGSYFMSGMASSYLRQSRAARAFAPVAATVVSASVASRGSKAGTSGTSYYPLIVYRYQVGGREFTSDRYYFTGPGWRDFAAAQAVAARFPAGGVVEAYYDPAAPFASVLDRRKPPASMLLFAAPLLVFGCFVVLLGLRP